MSLFLGLDSSTQSLKAMLIDAEGGAIVATEAVNFGRDLPEYKSPNGFLESHDPLVRHSDPMMWLAALDLLLGRLSKSGASLGEVAGIGGSGQQHGSVYLNASFPELLDSLSSSSTLAEQLAPALSRRSSPIWMDSSTGAECREIEKAIGSRLQSDTGSPAIERFTGPQIRRFALLEPEAYGNTSFIHLVSSFMASVLCGANAPIDFGDGAGMNLLNLRTMKWDTEIAEAAAPGLLSKLPPVKPSNTVAGKLHRYFAKYGLKAGIPVAVFTGDNPASLIGAGAARPGVAVVSLGTSDTFFAAMTEMTTDPAGCGHVFGNPAGGFMSLICFKNGSLARERVKDSFNASWDEFDKDALSSAPGNDGNMMLPHFVPEITPPVLKPGLRLKGDPLFESGKAPAAAMFRAVLESQALALKLHSRWMGTEFKTVRLTGGASRSRALCRIFADVFQARIEKISVPDSAALGAAMVAANAAGGFKWEDLNAKFCKAEESISPDASLKGLYGRMLEDFSKFEQG